MIKYICHYTTGGGKEVPVGIWIKKETDKTLSFEYDDNLYFEPNYKTIKINKFYSKKQVRKDGNYNAYRDFEDYRAWQNNGHVIRDWRDGTYTAYPNQAGIPYYFEPLDK